jgi:hypothetical protein
MAGITIFINASLFELCGVGTAVWIMAIGAHDLPLSHRHMRRAHELGLALQMTLTANFDFRSINTERRYVGQFRELLAAGLCHQRVTVDASQTAVRVRARLPVSLNAALVAAETRFVLHIGGLARILAERDYTSRPFAAARGDVIAARAVAIFASSLLGFVTWIDQKNFPHQGGREFFKGGSVTGLTNFVADVGGRA